jgi:serine protease DegS
MAQDRIRQVAIFLSGSVSAGIAIAFLLAQWRPDLIGRSPAATPAGPSGVTGPTARVLAWDTAVPAAPDAAPPVAATLRTATNRSSPSDGPPLVDPTILPATPGVASYAAAVKASAPAVVNIATQGTVTERVPGITIEELIRGQRIPRYRERLQRNLGSGVIIDARGHIVTNHHLIANADQITVELGDGRTGPATVVGRDPDTDLALLKIGLTGLPVMKFGDSRAIQVGDVVLAIGSPLGLSQTVTHGIVSATGRARLGVATYENFIQTDAAINVGNSGGALVNVRGELIGINTAVPALVGNQKEAEGIGFAIPVDLVRGVTRELLDKGRVVRGWIGILPEDVDDSIARLAQLAHGGVAVSAVLPQSPAAVAGLARGDIVDRIDGQPVRNSQDALARIARHRPGESVRVELSRRQPDAGVVAVQLSMEVMEAPRAR